MSENALYISKSDVALAELRCDLGDSVAVRVYMYPHRDHLSDLDKFVHYDELTTLREKVAALEALVKEKDTLAQLLLENLGVGWYATALRIREITPNSIQSRAQAQSRVIEAAKELRIYCLGSDCSTLNMIERFDAALTELEATK